mgnify:CR=1 FL=1
MFNHAQFILSKITAEGDKIPCDEQGGAINAHDPKHWMPFEDALTKSAENNLRPAFVLTNNDPYFCVDIDYCLLPDGSGWSQTAKDVCNMFPGAMVEVSQSGKALHIWGTSSTFSAHGCKNIPLHLELYTEKRFIVLGSNQTGDCDLDQTANLSKFIAKYMAPRAGQQGDQDFNWTTSPVSEWDGPEDDNELIEKAFKSQSAASVFGGSALSFEALWTKNERILSETWPHATNGFDGSSADMSLAQRLAFWTGKDCARIERLMRKSELYRTKWDERPDYLRRTILNACSAQTKVYSDPKKSVNRPLSRKFAGGFVGQEDIPEVFAGCVYITKEHTVLTPDGLRLKPEQFRVHYGGYVFCVSDQRTTRNAFEAFTECPSWRPPTATSVCFRPEEPPLEIIEEGQETMVNIYKPVHIESRKGDVSRFEKLINTLYPHGDDAEIIRTYMAACVQHIGRKFQWAPLLQGPEGNGKTFLIGCVQKAIGPRYCHTVNAHDLAGNGSKFNAWLFGKAFIVIEEIRVGNKTEMMDAMKHLITNSEAEIQAKGKDQITTDNRANFILTSNHMDALVLKGGGNDRRYAPIAAAQQNKNELTRAGLTPQFFADLWDWARGSGGYAGKTPGYVHINHWLKNYRLDERFNPAGGCVRAPMTRFYDSFVINSLGGAEQEVLEAIEENRPGFAGDWVGSSALDNLLEQKKYAHRISHIKRKQMLFDLGYMLHPALPDGRATRKCPPDQVRSRIYVKEGSLSSQLSDPTIVMEKYSAAQVKAMQAPVDSQGQTGLS